MAPILKELEAAPAASPNAAAPPSARPQPVALEIPVTVNGARTVDGSDKRAPFSESTQTVLVFPHGAVIRITTPLVPGQLVFLTNEKTKKEVVCQVVKSKSSGGTGAYVELQFTEPSASFWGLQIPGASAAPPAPRLVPSPAPSAPKPAAPVAPVAVKPPVAPIPVAPKPPAPVAISTPAVMPVAPPPPPVAAVPVIPIPEAVQPVAPVSAAPPAPLISAPPPPVAHTEPAVPAAPDIQSNANPVPPLRDYSKQIEAIFSAAPVPAPPAAPEQHHAPLPPAPSTEHLKEEATRLQAQLSSLLFTQPTSAPPVVPAAPPVHLDAPKTVSDVVALEPPKSAAPIESKPAVPAQKLSSLPLGADEEVKMPSWLAPLSQNSEPAAVESPASSEVAHDHSVSVNSEESYDALVGGAHQRPQTAVFSGQLLGESSASAADSSSGSKKGLFFGLAAAGVLLATGGGWYFLQNHPASPATAAVRSSNVPSSSAAAPTSNSAAPSDPSASTVASNRPNSTSVNAETPSRNSAPVVPAPVASAAAAPVSKNSKPTPKNPDPVETAPEKPALGDVHLAAPVVHSADSQQDQADPNALQSIDTKTVPADGDPFAAAAAHHAAPAAPLPVGGDVKEARLIKSVPPEYPTLAKAQHVSGKVQMDALIDASGNVSAVKVLSGPTLLHRAALDAVKQWKYKPAMLDGQATSMHLTVTVEFRNQ
jgi:TonB family protein